MILINSPFLPSSHQSWSKVHSITASLFNLTLTTLSLSEVLNNLVIDHSSPFQHSVSVIPDSTNSPIGLWPYNLVSTNVSGVTQFETKTLLLPVSIIKLWLSLTDRSYTSSNAPSTSGTTSATLTPPFNVITVLPNRSLAIHLVPSSNMNLCSSVHFTIEPSISTTRA